MIIYFIFYIAKDLFRTFFIFSKVNQENSLFQGIKRNIN